MKTNVKTLALALLSLFLVVNASAQRTYNPRTDPRANGQSTQQQLRNQQQGVNQGNSTLNLEGIMRNFNLTMEVGTGLVPVMNDFVPGQPLMSSHLGLTLGGILEAKLPNPLEEVGVLTWYAGGYGNLPFNSQINGHGLLVTGFRYQPESLSGPFWNRIGAGLYANYATGSLTVTQNGISSQVDTWDARRVALGGTVDFALLRFLFLSYGVSRPVNGLPEYTDPGDPLMTNLWSHMVKLTFRLRIGRGLTKQDFNWNNQGYSRSRTGYYGY